MNVPRAWLAREPAAERAVRFTGERECDADAWPAPVRNDSVARAIPIACYAESASTDTGGHNENPRPPPSCAPPRGMLVAVITADCGKPQRYARGWLRVRLDGPVYAHLAPRSPWHTAVWLLATCLLALVPGLLGLAVLVHRKML
ncbi:hypothetical protein ACWGJB_16925 [Streptomyces sp. NPDC054813]